MQPVFPNINVNHQFFKNLYFWSNITECSKLDSSIGHSQTICAFKSNTLKFVRLIANSIFSCYNPIEVKLLTRLRVWLSHFYEHKFKRNFQNNPFHFAVAEKGLKLILIFSFHIIITLTKDWSSWTKLGILILSI